MSGARDPSIHHRPAAELVPDSVLDGMERDGWTPSQVRALIASYRQLRDELDVVDSGYVLPGKQRNLMRRHAFALVETELREFCVEEVQLGPGGDARITQRHRSGSALHFDRASLFEAVENLRRSRHG